MKLVPLGPLLGGPDSYPGGGMGGREGVQRAKGREGWNGGGR